ncbi:MAG: hypothetical protein KQJ78_09555 [Deltaproteobacteria bacterium]|nr:hypothetical protein [Deltaproteobacteria bacterium]
MRLRGGYLILTLTLALGVGWAVGLPGLAPVRPALAGDQRIDVCGLYAPAEVSQLFGKKKKTFEPHAEGRGCYWTKPGEIMALWHVGYQETDMPVRDFFFKDLPPQVKLAPVPGLGEEALMSVSEGTLGVVAARKGKYVVTSAATFLDIKPGSEREKLLMEFLHRVLDKLD